MLVTPYDMALSLLDCKQEIRQLQSRCLAVRVGKPMRVFAVSDIHTDFKGNMLWLRELVSWAGDQVCYVYAR